MRREGSLNETRRVEEKSFFGSASVVAVPLAVAGGVEDGMSAGLWPLAADSDSSCVWV